MNLLISHLVEIHVAQGIKSEAISGKEGKDTRSQGIYSLQQHMQFCFKVNILNLLWFLISHVSAEEVVLEVGDHLVVVVLAEVEQRKQLLVLVQELWKCLFLKDVLFYQPPVFHLFSNWAYINEICHDFLNVIKCVIY